MADENDELATKLTRAARRRRRCWWFPTKDLRRCRNPAPELFPLCSAHRKKFIRVLLATAGVVIVAAFVTEPVKRFVWREPVCSGDVITTTAALESREDRNDKTLLVLRTISQNQLGQLTAEGWWTELIRGGLPA